MKKLLILLTLLLSIACCFAGCGKDVEEIDPYGELKASFAALGLRVQSVEQEGSLLRVTGAGGFRGEILRTDSGRHILCHAPEALEGLSVTQDAGGLCLSMEGISRRMDPAALPQQGQLAGILRILQDTEQ